MLEEIVFGLVEGAIMIVVELISQRSKFPNGRLPLERKAELDALLKHPKELQRLLREHQKIQAIKLYREETKASLKEAKIAVEMTQDEMLVSQYEARLTRRNSTSLQEIQYFLQTGDKLQAIKVYRKSTGADLKEAKKAVDALAAKMLLGQEPQRP